MTNYMYMCVTYLIEKKLILLGFYSLQSNYFLLTSFSKQKEVSTWVSEMKANLLQNTFKIIQLEYAW